jgi:hypothetical protein
MQIDDATGFLIDPADTFEPRLKTALLKAYKKTGDLSASADALGINNLTVEHHLEIDKAFNAALHSAELEMKHSLEGMMFRDGNKAGGQRARMAWLQAKFPQEYGTKGRGRPDKDQKAAFESLLED